MVARTVPEELTNARVGQPLSTHVVFDLFVIRIVVMPVPDAALEPRSPTTSCPAAQRGEVRAGVVEVVVLDVGGWVVGGMPFSVVGGTACPVVQAPRASARAATTMTRNLTVAMLPRGWEWRASRTGP